MWKKHKMNKILKTHSLEKRIEELEVAMKAAATANERLRRNLRATQNSRDTAQERFADADKKVIQLTSENDVLQGIINDLREELTAANKKAAKAPAKKAPAKPRASTKKKTEGETK